MSKAFIDTNATDFNISKTVMCTVSIRTSEFCSAGPIGSIRLIVMYTDAARLCKAESKFILRALSYITTTFIG